VNFVSILCCLLSGVGAATSRSDAPPDPPPSTATPPNQRTIEILIVGPEDARNRMVATIRPLLGTDPDLRWATQDSVPTDGAITEPSNQGTAQIRIDVSSPTQLRVYLPAEPKGRTTVRTIARAAADSEAADLLDREAVAQIVKAAVLALREGAAQPAKEAPTHVDEKRSWQGAPHGKFDIRLYAGLAYFVGSERRSYRGWGTSFGVSLGGFIARNIILYGEVVGTMVPNPDVSDSSYFASPLGTDHVWQLGFGPGIAYHLEPRNFRLSATLTFPKVWLGGPGSTNLGVGINLTAGKEWWVSDDWRIGVAAQAHLATMSHNDPNPYNDPPDYNDSAKTRLYTGTFALLFSATYN
jgi:Na+-transporting methylmalonyl-CoA/oxaloacetate decarboxylase gamma subunit